MMMKTALELYTVVLSDEEIEHLLDHVVKNALPQNRAKMSEKMGGRVLEKDQLLRNSSLMGVYLLQTNQLAKFVKQCLQRGRVLNALLLKKKFRNATTIYCDIILGNLKK